MKAHSNSFSFTLVRNQGFPGKVALSLGHKNQNCYTQYLNLSLSCIVIHLISSLVFHRLFFFKSCVALASSKNQTVNYPMSSIFSKILRPLMPTGFKGLQRGLRLGSSCLLHPSFMSATESAALCQLRSHC